MTDPFGVIEIPDLTHAHRVLSKIHDLANTLVREFGHDGALKELWITGPVYDSLTHLFLSDPRSVLPGNDRWRNGILEVYTQSGLVVVRRAT